MGSADASQLLFLDSENGSKSHRWRLYNKTRILNRIFNDGRRRPFIHKMLYFTEKQVKTAPRLGWKVDNLKQESYPTKVEASFVEFFVWSYWHFFLLLFLLNCRFVQQGKSQSHWLYFFNTLFGNNALGNSVIFPLGLIRRKKIITFGHQTC